jgi:hypothetical protein
VRSTYITKDQAPEEINNLILLLKFDTILSICFGHTDQTVGQHGWLFYKYHARQTPTR